MKIEVEEYVRTKSGKIYKIDKIEECSICFEPLYVNIEKIKGIKFTNSYHIKDIKKHSKNIIDLIEVGDYVNERRVFATKNRIDGEKVILVENYSEWTDDAVVLNKDIETIVTKEQFKEMEYRVDEV